MRLPKTPGGVVNVRLVLAALTMTCVLAPFQRVGTGLASAAEILAQSHIRSYKETICINPNGSAEVHATVAMGEYAGINLYLPMNYVWVDKISARIVETGESLPVEITTVEGTDALCVTLGQRSISGKTLDLTFRDPAYLLWRNAGPGDFGHYQHTSEFQNTSRLVIDEFSMEVVLPEGFVLHRITKSIPALKKTDPSPPYSFVNIEGSSHLFINARDLSPGKGCMLQYTFVKKKGSYVFLGGCIVLMALSLIFFRDMLKEGDDASHPK